MSWKFVDCYTHFIRTQNGPKTQLYIDIFIIEFQICLYFASLNTILENWNLRAAKTMSQEWPEAVNYYPFQNKLVSKGVFKWLTACTVFFSSCYKKLYIKFKPFRKGVLLTTWHGRFCALVIVIVLAYFQCN